MRNFSSLLLLFSRRLGGGEALLAALCREGEKKRRDSKPRYDLTVRREERSSLGLVMPGRRERRREEAVLASLSLILLLGEVGRLVLLLVWYTLPPPGYTSHQPAVIATLQHGAAVHPEPR